MTQHRHRGSVNLPFVIMIALPSFAILASVGAAAVAMLDGDPTLPDQYHWEGLKLDYDFARSQRAADLDVRARLQLVPAARLCRVTLQLNAPLPPAIILTAIHGAHPELDQRVELTRRGNSYEAACKPMPVAQWHVELSDGAGAWSVREDSTGALDNVSIVARLPTG